jgi:hypothetical protein
LPAVAQQFVLRNAQHAKQLLTGRSCARNHRIGRYSTVREEATDDHLMGPASIDLQG